MSYPECACAKSTGESNDIPIVLGSGVSSSIKHDGFGNPYLEVISDAAAVADTATSLSNLGSAAASGDTDAIAAIQSIAPFIELTVTEG